MDRLNRRDLQTFLHRRGAVLSFVIGIGAFLLGAALVARQANSNDGSPFGWLFIVIGICGVLAAIGFVSGIYD
jgi:hypothetical protein